MISGTSLFAALALGLPFILGSVWTRWLLGFAGRRHPGIILGYGYFLGIFLVTLLLRIWHLLGLSPNFGLLALTVAGLSVIGAVLVARQKTHDTGPTEFSPVPGWQWVVLFALVALIGLRYITILQEVLLRPLYPWDTWMNWAPKPTVWFHYGEMVPFVSMSAWLDAPPEALAYSEGASNAWKYPIAVPLIQLWTMIAIDSSDSTLIYLPWALIAPALGAAIYGQLRMMGLSRLVSVIPVYLMLSMPFINVHSALAGYADLWVACVFCCSVLCIKEWERSRNWPYLLLALLMAVFCMQLKIPGTVLAGITILTLTCTFIDFRKKSGYLILGGLVISGLLILAMNLEFELAGLGKVVLSFDRIKLPYIGDFDIAYHPVHRAIIDSLFTMINWNIFWYLVVPIAAIYILYRGQRESIRTETVSVTLTLGFLFFVYLFTPRAEFAADFTQFNRAMLYAIPVLIFAGFSIGFSGKTVQNR